MADNSQEPETDAILIQGVLAGNAETFAGIVQRYHAPLLRVAQSKLKNLDIAEEAVQETVLWAFKSLHTYDSRYSFRTWLWTILLNRCRRILQKQNRSPKVVSWNGYDQQRNVDPIECPDDQPSPEMALMRRERSQLLESLMQTLPANQADAVRLRFFGELKYQEIADTMRCSISSAKNRVRWGLEKISVAIQTHPSASILRESSNGDEP